MRRYRELDEIGRIQLSRSFFFRDFLFSEIGAAFGIPNVPDDLDLAVYAGRELCERILEPLQAAFGRIHIRSGYRSSRLNAFGNERGLNCSRNERTYADHIWDKRDGDGHAGACTCVVVPWFVEHHRPDEWEKLAWWVHDHLDYHRLVFFGRQASFNVGWRENPLREIRSHVAPRGILTGPGMLNGWGDHSDQYQGFPALPKPPRPALQPVANGNGKSAPHCTPLHGHREQRAEAFPAGTVTCERTSACDEMGGGA